MDDTDTFSAEQWDRWVEADVDARLPTADAERLRADEALPQWRAALVRYQRRLEAELRAASATTGPSGQRRLVKDILRDVQARFGELRQREKAAARRRQQAVKEAARQRRQERERDRQAQARRERAVRSSPEGQRLHQSIHRRALRLTRWAARMAEEMGLDEEDPDWSRWLDDFDGLNAMSLRFEAMAAGGEE